MNFASQDAQSSGSLESFINQLNFLNLEIIERNCFTKIDFGVSASDRRYRLECIDQYSKETTNFFVNMEHLTDLAPVLCDEIISGKIEVPTEDFETLLNLIFHNFHYSERITVLGLQMPKILNLARRYKTKNLLEEIRNYVLKTNLHSMSIHTVREWFGGFSTNKMDEDQQVINYLSEHLAKPAILHSGPPRNKSVWKIGNDEYELYLSTLNGKKKHIRSWASWDKPTSNWKL